MLTFRITHEESGGRARVGVLTTARSEIATPAFMPVGSLGNVRSVDGEELLKMGYGLILNNAYHLYLRPGHKVVEELGGVHGFTAWPGACLLYTSKRRQSSTKARPMPASRSIK